MGVKKIQKKQIKINDEEGALERTFIEGTKIVSFAHDDNTAKIQIQEASKIPASLVLLAGPNQLIGHSWSLDKKISTVGRSSRLANVVIPESSMSKIHFQIQAEKDGIFIIDLQSTNKTFLNEKNLVPYQKYPIGNNFQIRVGNAILKFLEEGSIELLSNRKVLDRSYKDSLTGFLNREALEIEGKQFFKSGKNFCVITYDIDHFKRVNDTYGHLAGDFILEQISIQVQKLVREGDKVFRYGGEEFCVLTYNTFEIAKNIAKRIREQIEKQDFKFKNKVIKVTTSLGVSSLKRIDIDWKDVYDRADSCLYKAKNFGRNKVISED